MINQARPDPSTSGTTAHFVAVLYGVLAGEGGACIERGECLRLCAEWEERMEPALLAATLFADADRVTFPMFTAWIEKHHQVRYGTGRGDTDQEYLPPIWGHAE